MFKILTNKKAKLDFNTNKLIIKLNKKALINAAIRPKELNLTSQDIKPVAEQVNEPMFEIY